MKIKVDRFGHEFIEESCGRDELDIKMWLDEVAEPGPHRMKVLAQRIDCDKHFQYILPCFVKVLKTYREKAGPFLDNDTPLYLKINPHWRNYGETWFLMQASPKIRLRENLFIALQKHMDSYFPEQGYKLNTAYRTHALRITASAQLKRHGAQDRQRIAIRPLTSPAPEVMGKYLWNNYDL